MNIYDLYSQLYLRKNMFKLNYEITKEDNYVTLSFNADSYDIFIALRLQFDSVLRWSNFSYLLKNEIHKNIYRLITNDLLKYYKEDDLILTARDFYQNSYSFSQDIQNQEELEIYLSEFLKCVKFYETEIFPKLTDIRFLAEFVGSVPFENNLEIVVGGTYPVTIFKKLAILKWGNHPRYEEYKQGLATFIEEDFLDPKYQQEAPLYKKGFEKLIYHLENEPNPFL
ncbi:hypothetical protein CGC56_07260 [Capnocytophaga canimorsus]|uniref:Uncharacterized protein n=1 Tax=Capnocytophaga canimorsus TaxID=28188 RepID=A0A250G705_9FLAO|nr:hypothetical protein [Capnocytophaga canimorsus]ATA91977.1 hypothetical protein CGC56_07260 [Capnocytophaga canimorsus]ATA93824.1 hypothetical protein CGC54_05465 [Capnocytophaga canimorsus]